MACNINISHLLIVIGQVVLRVFVFEADSVVCMLSLSHNTLIPNGNTVEFTLSSCVFASDVCKYQVCIPVEKWVQVCFKIESEAQTIFVVISISQECVYVLNLEGLSDSGLVDIIASEESERIA